MPSQAIYFIRHAESEFNASQCEQGVLEDSPQWRDSPLTARGVEQCQALRRELQDVQFDAVVVSPLRRARQTLQHLALDPALPVLESELCREHRLHYCDLRADEVGELTAETYEQVMQHVEQFKRWVREDLRMYSCIAVVSHCDFVYYCCEPDHSVVESVYWLDNATYAVVD